MYNRTQTAVCSEDLTNNTQLKYNKQSLTALDSVHRTKQNPISCLCVRLRQIKQILRYLEDFDDTFFVSSDVNSLKNFTVLSTT